MKKLLSALLCVAMLFSLAACTQTPEPAPTQDPTEPPAEGIFTDAAQALKSLSDVTVDLTIDTLTTVAGEKFSELSTQNLTYLAAGKDDAIIAVDETLEFGLHLEEDEEEDEEEEPFKYSEIWSKDTVYAQLDEDYLYSSKLDAEAAAKRYTPVVLLDASLYSSITSEKATEGTRIVFADATAAESWVLPEDAQMQSASGNATVNAEGRLTEMNYEITYTYGPASVTKKFRCVPQDTPKTVTVPESAEDYAAISHIDAVRTGVSSLAYLFQASTISLQSTDVITSEAAGVVSSKFSNIHLHGRKKDTIAKVDTDVNLINYASGKDEQRKQEEVFLDGKLTTTVNDGLPSTVPNITWEDIREYVGQAILEGYLDMGYWDDATITDLGSLYYLEFDLNENFGNTMQNEICSNFWGDPSFLVNLASEYKNEEVTGYLSIDKYTGLPVAAGYYYKGVHTIEKQKYALISQLDQAIESPAKGAYKEITEEMPEEQEPETKPTPLFYKVTGQNGQQMWLLGTIHIGDERTAYLPQEIRDAFEASDALALECDTEKFDEQIEKDEKLAQKVSDLYFYSDGKEHIKEAMSEEDYAAALKLLKAVGGYNLNLPYAKPYIWSNTIEQFYLRQGYQLHQDQGVEERLTAWAKELGKEIWEIESSMDQIKMSTGFSDDLQMWMLEDVLTGNAREYWESSWELYQMWCEGNEETLRQEISSQWSEMTEEEAAKYGPLMEEYDKAMSFDRNEGMLDTAVEYLESGKVIFYAVGLAHLLDSTNGLVDALQQAGYTVELVSYAG